MHIKDYCFGLTVKQGTNLDFLPCCAQDGKIIASARNKTSNDITWEEGFTELEAVANLKKKLGDVEKWDSAYFEVCVFDENGKMKDIAPGPIYWTRNGYSPDDAKMTELPKTSGVLLEGQRLTADLKIDSISDQDRDIILELILSEIEDYIFIPRRGDCTAYIELLKDLYVRFKEATLTKESN